MRQSGLILLLPHGFDGTGPEHSSAKIERFLQLTDTNGIHSLYDTRNPIDHRKINMCVAQPTKPSNYFHILRRQMLRSYRKPLILISPKIGLKHSAYVANMSELTKDHKFSPIIVDNYNNDLSNLSQLKGIIFCSGQVYLEIKKYADALLKENKKVNFITVRVEELAPFPEKQILNLLSKKTGLNAETKFYWIQEESMNAGCFTYVAPHLRRIMRNCGISQNEVYYIGREAQVGANGCLEDHKKEAAKLSEEINKLISS